jgi:hypothetical protein
MVAELGDESMASSSADGLKPDQWKHADVSRAMETIGIPGPVTSAVRDGGGDSSIHGVLLAPDPWVDDDPWRRASAGDVVPDSPESIVFTMEDRRLITETHDGVLRLLARQKAISKPSRTRSLVDDADEATNLSEALSGMPLRAKMTKWIGGKDYGFAVALGKEIFVHTSSVKGDIAGIVGKEVVLQVALDKPKGADKLRADSAQRLEEFRAERAAEQKIRSANATAIAAEIFADEAARCSKLSSVMSAPPGLVVAPVPALVGNAAANATLLLLRSLWVRLLLNLLLETLG